MSHHRQCKLVKGDATTVSWIPEKFAQEGEYLKLKDNGVWEDGWKVEFVGTKLPTKYVINRSQDHVHQREASDI
jgi:hypothetical protein